MREQPAYRIIDKYGSALQISAIAKRHERAGQQDRQDNAAFGRKRRRRLIKTGLIV